VLQSEGRSDIQRLNDVDGDPVVVGQYLVTTSYQGQVTVTDWLHSKWCGVKMLAVRSALKVGNDKVFVAQTDGKVVAYEISTGQKLWENDSFDEPPIE
jgi:outer membrane protein assembly factor BamB